MSVLVLDNRLRFPNPQLADDEGLIAIGGDLSVERLLLAYRSGIFPWTAEPVTWWSPDPRAIFELDRFQVSRSLAKVLRRGVFQVTTDRAFREVMEGCAEPRLGHRALVDPAGEPFGNRGLAHARLADEQRIVLAASAEHLDHVRVSRGLHRTAPSRPCPQPRMLARPAAGRWYLWGRHRRIFRG